MDWPQFCSARSRRHGELLSDAEQNSFKWICSSPETGYGQTLLRDEKFRKRLDLSTDLLMEDTET